MNEIISDSGKWYEEMKTWGQRFRQDFWKGAIWTDNWVTRRSHPCPELKTNFPFCRWSKSGLFKEQKEGQWSIVWDQEQEQQELKYRKDHIYHVKFRIVFPNYKVNSLEGFQHGASWLSFYLKWIIPLSKSKSSENYLILRESRR